ncbi:DUF4160 domain-containing protein [Thalassospira marina]|uniref:DUF4160 domain-containing protein n=1 Tax=Thalassospira marina TaxID=2048283 RepID=A0ABM6QB65_9PROT|nr:DUF4160 domain-containing protein [Thalassospira marina]AUG53768.1 hypothetical protein CSC3H3_14395 [Thalassospira marina]
MPTIEDFGSFKIYMYFGDHNPPHIHVIGADFAAKIRILDAEVFAGKLPGKIGKQACAYVITHKDRLMAIWQDYNG